MENIKSVLVKLADGRAMGHCLKADDVTVKEQCGILLKSSKQ